MMIIDRCEVIDIKKTRNKKTSIEIIDIHDLI